MIRLALALGLICGCHSVLGPGSPGEVPGQAAALDLVWHDWLGEDSSPPTVWLVTGDDLDCVTASGRTGYEFLGECRLGFTPGAALGHIISLAYHGEDVRELPLVHEAMHARQARHWVFDPGHKRSEWARVPAMELQLGGVSL